MAPAGDGAGAAARRFWRSTSVDWVWPACDAIRNLVVSAVADLAGDVRPGRGGGTARSATTPTVCCGGSRTRCGSRWRPLPRRGSGWWRRGAADPGTVDIASGSGRPGGERPGMAEHPGRRAVGRGDRIARRHRTRRRLAGSLGEVAFGAGRGSAHAVFVTLLDGIGGGIVENGKLLTGRDGSAGEIGHTRGLRGGAALWVWWGRLSRKLTWPRPGFPQPALAWGTPAARKSAGSFGEAPDDEFAGCSARGP